MVPSAVFPRPPLHEHGRTSINALVDFFGKATKEQYDAHGGGSIGALDRANGDATGACSSYSMIGYGHTTDLNH
ncbi:unnamed protein product [Heligmosomoides polygyrus]|uniref:SCP domain-containing protein n=1 Tax=Heligmosomoides polygyrus TaxID=6339 RepID=A0A183GDD7_HELPZ|nr:unnamed protein product [Heligmosomoides polygyrus]